MCTVCVSECVLMCLWSPTFHAWTRISNVCYTITNGGLVFWSVDWVDEWGSNNFPLHHSSSLKCRNHCFGVKWRLSESVCFGLVSLLATCLWHITRNTLVTCLDSVMFLLCGHYAVCHLQSLKTEPRAEDDEATQKMQLLTSISFIKCNIHYHLYLCCISFD